jgi:hypothetical protein
VWHRSRDFGAGDKAVPSVDAIAIRIPVQKHGPRFRQIGNAVPPLLASAIGRQLAETLSNAADRRSTIHLPKLIAAKNGRACRM